MMKTLANMVKDARTLRTKIEDHPLCNQFMNNPKEFMVVLHDDIVPYSVVVKKNGDKSKALRTLYRRLDQVWQDLPTTSKNQVLGLKK